MNLETFFEKFDIFADAPDAVAKMRELVLHLAVTGKLLPQDPNDEPAEECLTRIGIKNTLPSDEANDSLPSSWSRVRFEDVAVTAGGVTLGRKLGDRKTVTLPYLRVANVKRGEIDLSVIKEVTIGEDEIDRYALREDDLLMTEGGDWDKVGRAAIWKAEIPICLHQNHVFRSRMRSSEISPVWFARYFNSPEGRRYFESASKQTTNLASINMRQVRGCPVPLPPLAEQRRIMAKVDELMALCDRLAQQQEERETRHAALARASLARFADAPTPANLPLLFHGSFPIPPSDLRKSILTLAVQGKLVPQDPNDGDARELIDRAMKKREQTIKSKNLRRKQLDESADLFSPDDLPSSWCIERFAKLVDPQNTISYGVLVPGNDVADGVPFVRAQDLTFSNHPGRPNKTIAPEIEKPYARTRLTGGEILLCVVGSIGKLGVVPESWAGANIARAVARIKPIPDVDRDYLLIVLQETAVQTFFTSSTRTLAQPTLNVGLIEQTPIPVPPLAEQRRIVAKVDELMALVDALETQLATARTAATALLAAAFAELTATSANVPSANGAPHTSPGQRPGKPLQNRPRAESPAQS